MHIWTVQVAFCPSGSILKEAVQLLTLKRILSQIQPKAPLVCFGLCSVLGFFEGSKRNKRFHLRGQDSYSVRRVGRILDFTVSSPKKVDFSFLSDSQPGEHGPWLKLLIGHIKMTRKIAFVLLEMQFYAIRESSRNLSRLSGKLTKNKELEFRRLSCMRICCRLFQ